MNKLFFLSFILLSVFSCTSDDDSDSNNLDPFIGTWHHFSEDGNESNDCEKKSFLKILENNTYSASVYSLINNECLQLGETQGKWSNEGDNNYNLAINDNNNEKNIRKVVFTDNNNTFYFKDSNNTTTTFKRK